MMFSSTFTQLVQEGRQFWQQRPDMCDRFDPEHDERSFPGIEDGIG